MNSKLHRQVLEAMLVTIIDVHLSHTRPELDAATQHRIAVDVADASAFHVDMLLAFNNAKDKLPPLPGFEGEQQ